MSNEQILILVIAVSWAISTVAMMWRIAALENRVKTLSRVLSNTIVHTGEIVKLLEKVTAVKKGAK